MDESVQVKSIFNDFYVLFNANKGVLALYDKYKDNNLFMALIGNLNLAVVSDANAIMKETYAFYKRYADRELSEAERTILISPGMIWKDGVWSWRQSRKRRKGIFRY